MQKTQLKDGVRNIKKRLVSYLSICLVIMLGLGVFLNMRYMSAGVGRKASDYLTDLHYKDFEYISTLGSSDDTIERIKQIEGVTDAEGVMLFDAHAIADEGRRNVTLLSLTERISTPKLVEGEMPVAEDECLVGEDYAEKEGISVGDSLTIHIADLKDKDNPLKKQEFTVSGLMMHPDYAHRGAINTVVMPLAAFDMSATSDAYTRVFVKTDDVPLDDFFTDAYFDATKKARTNLEDAADSLADAREKELKDKAYAEIDKQWAEAEAKLAEAENEIENGKNQLNSELAAGRKKLNDAEDTLANKLRKNRKKIKNGEKNLKEGRKELKAAKKEVAKQKEILKDTRKKAKLAQTILNLIVPLIEDITPGDDDPPSPNEKKLAQLIIDDDGNEKNNSFENL